MNTIKCIICGEEKKGSIEHIIPEALGNKKLITKKVCEDCNTKLGDKVDYYLTEDFLFKILRKENNFTGKKNHDIKIFKSVLKDSKGDLYDINETEYTASLRPITIETEKGYISKAESIEEARDSARKKLERNGKTPEQINNILNKARVEKEVYEPPIFEIEFKTPLGKMLLAIIKTAYEYASEKLGDLYFEDELGEKIRSELYEVVYDEKNINFEFIKQIFMASPNFVKQMINESKDNLKSLPVVHMIILHRDSENHLICNISFFLNPSLTYSIRLSDNADKYMKDTHTFVELVFEDGGTLTL